MYKNSNGTIQPIIGGMTGSYVSQSYKSATGFELFYVAVEHVPNFTGLQK